MEPAQSNSPSRISRLLLTLAVFVVVLAADLASKQWAWDNLRGGESVAIIEEVLYFKFGFNTGSAFSFLRDASWGRPFFITISFAALAYMAWLAWSIPTKRFYGFLAIGLIAGGDAGNLHDRFVRTMTLPWDGEMQERYGVVDFIQFFYHWDSQRFWPIFNIADSALVCGVFILFWYIRKQGQEEAELEAAAQQK